MNEEQIYENNHVNGGNGFISYSTCSMWR
ncbi:hypothetical protein [Bacillus thuringiensis]